MKRTKDPVRASSSLKGALQCSFPVMGGHRVAPSPTTASLSRHNHTRPLAYVLSSNDRFSSSSGSKAQQRLTELRRRDQNYDGARTGCSDLPFSPANAAKATMLEKRNADLKRSDLKSCLKRPSLETMAGNEVIQGFDFTGATRWF
ncbi:hypothetical protein SESBI_36772 [Sesbania bispinosa]|nr:hypothetical protein SESBI_36772 [Sesbania bispinosa]